MNKTAIKNFAIWARNKLIKEITYKAGLVGVTEKGIADALPQSSKGMQWFDIGTSEPSNIQGEAIRQREKLVQRIREKEQDSDYKTAYTSIIEEVAYTWFNRLIAIRFMEVNDYLPSRVRVLSSETVGKEEPDLVTSPFESDLEFTSTETDLIMQYKDANQLDELFRMLFIKQCNKLNEILPELFEKTADYTELLLNISYTDKDGVVYHLNHDIDAEDFCVRENEAGQVTGQIEIIGWLYQYYNTEPKDEAFALLKKNVKVTKERIPAVTQLFTPGWIVKYMVENSLGRLWIEGHPNDELKKNWKYYLEEAEQEEDVQKELEIIREEYKQLKPEDIKVIDPCMGSGHILVYAFEVLMQIYEANGYSQRDAAKSILKNNIYGLDIDNRAYQLAYFAVMMKARQYNRRILTNDIKPHIYAIRGSNFITDDLIDFISNGSQQLKKDMQSICNDLKDAEEYGSILNISPINFNRLYARFSEIEQTQYEDIFSDYYKKIVIKEVKNLVGQIEVMFKKYKVVITNPPYMGLNGTNKKLNEYIKRQYPNSKNDMFAVFIEKCMNMTEEQGYQAMITQHSWMFLSSYEELRNKLKRVDVINMAHLGARAFDEIGGEVVQTTSFVLRVSDVADYLAKYVRLIDLNNSEEKEKGFLLKDNLFISQKSNYYKIPGAPIAYWVTKKEFDLFNKNKKIGDYYDAKGGMTSGNNELFVRGWYEVNYNDIGLGHTKESAITSKKIWFPYNKGGAFRKWYGNMEYVINWYNDGSIIKQYKLQQRENNPNYNIAIAALSSMFKPQISWSLVSSASFGARYYPRGFLFDVAGSSLFVEEKDEAYLLAYLNTKIAYRHLQIINPTMNFQPGNIKTLVFLKRKEQEVNALAKECILIAKDEWDSFEISWEFKKHPFITTCKNIQEAFKNWAKLTEIRIVSLKEKEAELNKIFIETYELEDEVDSQIEENNITLRRANLQSDIRSFISYAIGCIYGRYSLDKEGLIYAGGEWDNSKYISFIPNKENIILITEDEYFTDDIVNRFVEFVKVVYGEETLEENLDFIANALGNKGNTSHEVIRNYFIKDFYKDHCKIYQKRPIYWLFDSGKQNGFKALIYMHRYNADTIGNLRIDYLHRLQKVYESEISRMQDIVDNSNNAKESTAAAKRRDKLVKQLQETKDYDQKIAHLALARTEIDLDDGVKVNYEKIQTGTDGKKLQVLAKI